MVYRVDFYGLEVYVDGDYVGHNDHFVIVETDEEIDEEALLSGAFECVQDDFLGEITGYEYYEITLATEEDIEEWHRWLSNHSQDDVV